MFIVGMLRYYITKLMYAPDSPLLNPASVSHKSLKGTMLEGQADLNKEVQEEAFDISKALDNIKADVKDK